MKIAFTPHQEKFIATKMKTGGYLSPDEIIREASRVGPQTGANFI